MRKNISIIAITSLIFVSSVYSTLAYYTPYYNNYSNTPTSNSYTFQQGCYTYSYDAYTRITSLIGSTCQVNTSYNYYPTYSSNYYPTYSSSYYPRYSYNTTPVNYTVTNPYYVYSYNNGYWTIGGATNAGYNYYDNYNYYYNNHVNTPNTSCYYVNGYYTCY